MSCFQLIFCQSLAIYNPNVKSTHLNKISHGKAYQYSKGAHSIIVRIFTFFAQQHPRISTSFSKNDKIEFSKIIIENSIPIIKQILTEQSYEKIQQSERLKKLRFCLSSWKINLGRKQADLNINKQCSISRQTHKQKTCRSILGVKLLQAQQDRQNDEQKVNKLKDIKEILNIKLISTKQFSINDNFIYHLSQTELRKKIQLLCVAYFFMGLEIEFANYIKQRSHRSINKRFQYLNQTKSTQSELVYQQKINCSQILKLKAVLLAVQNLGDNQGLISYLIQNYNRKYEGEMAPIVEQSSKFQSSSSIAEKPEIKSFQVVTKNQKHFDQKGQTSLQNIYYVRDQNPPKNTNLNKKIDKKDKKNRISMLEKKSSQTSKCFSKQISGKKRKFQSLSKYQKSNSRLKSASQKNIKRNINKRTHSYKKILNNKIMKTPNFRDNEQNMNLKLNKINLASK